MYIYIYNLYIYIYIICTMENVLPFSRLYSRPYRDRYIYIYISIYKENINKNKATLFEMQES